MSFITNGTIDETWVAKHTTMKPLQSIRQTIFAASLLALGSLPLKSQTVARIYEQTANKVVFTIENLKENTKPSKIILVYDSNLIALESTPENNNLLRNKHSRNHTFFYYSAANALSSTLKEDVEQEIALEEWMLKPFACESSKSVADSEQEEEIKIEPWMTDLTQW